MVDLSLLAGYISVLAKTFCFQGSEYQNQQRMVNGGKITDPLLGLTSFLVSNGIPVPLPIFTFLISL